MKIDPEKLQFLHGGKTKIILRVPEMPGYIVARFSDDITAGNGTKHDVVPGKGKLDCLTTAMIYGFLERGGVDTSFVLDQPEGLEQNELVMLEADMLPYEVVGRSELHGSGHRREPHLSVGYPLARKRIEYYLKSKDKKWKGLDLPVDDMMIEFEFADVENDKSRYIDSVVLYHPDHPLSTRKPFVKLGMDMLPLQLGYIPVMNKNALKIMLMLKRAWALCGFDCVDYKGEYGLTKIGNRLVLADEITFGSWRVVDRSSGVVAYRDKEFYRKGGDIHGILPLCEWTAEQVAKWRIPDQQIVLWTGSEKDDVAPFRQAIKDLVGENAPWLTTTHVVCSMHKSPVEGLNLLHHHLQKFPDTVVIANIGRSNGAGPTLSANCPVPVISVPNGWEKRTETVWSSLDLPSNTPASTMLYPANAVLQALQMLGFSNPAAYAAAAMVQEQTQSNFTMLT